MKDRLPDWSHRLDAIDDQTKTFERQGDETELAGLAAAFQLKACRRFVVRYTLQHMQDDQIKLKGDFQAEGEQACVVTLEPVPFALKEHIDVLFVPQEAHEELPEDEEHEALSLDDIEAYTGSMIEVGRVFSEHFGAALDPYPRAEGAVFSPPDAQADQDDGARSPFAALKDIKTRSQ